MNIPYFDLFGIQSNSDLISILNENNNVIEIIPKKIEN